MGQLAVRTGYMRTELLNFEIRPQSKQKSKPNCPATCVQAYTGTFNFRCMGQIAVLTAYMPTELLDFEIWPQSKQKSQSNCPAYMRTQELSIFEVWVK